MKKRSGKIFLIPTTLGDNNFDKVLPTHVLSVINNIIHFIVENTRTTRRFFSAYGITTEIDKLQFYELNKHTKNEEIDQFLNPLFEGYDMGVLSEAGLPGIADPGSIIVEKAHKKSIDIIPLVGPSSIILALISSGFNGQQFSFNGYLPIQKSERIKHLKTLENRVLKEGVTQLFMEAPYRNQKFLEDILESLHDSTKLCIACDITLENQYIKTKTVGDWRKTIPDINKRPAIFAIGKLNQ